MDYDAADGVRRGFSWMSPAMWFVGGVALLLGSAGLQWLYRGGDLMGAYFPPPPVSLELGVALLFALYAGVYYWFPRLSERPGWAYAHFWLTLISAQSVFFVLPPLFGMSGVPRRYYTFTEMEPSSLPDINALLTWAALVFVLAQGLFAYHAVATWRCKG